MRTFSALAATALAAALALAGCSNDSKSNEDPSSTPSQSASETGSSSPDRTGAACDWKDADQDPYKDAPEVSRDADPALPKVEEKFGEVPSFAWSGKEAPSQLVSYVISHDDAVAAADDSTEVGPNDYLVVRYAGRVWDGEQEFDSSFARGSVASFSLNQVVPGWKWGLAGTHIGDRVLVSIPAEFGYGPAGGNPKAGIGPDDTIVFVVDIVKAYSKHVTLGEGAKELNPSDLPVELAGDIPCPPQITVKDGAIPPTEAELTILAEGTGPKVAVTDVSLVVQFAAVQWDNTQGYSSWDDQGPYIDAIGGGGILDMLIGTPVGSRVLVTVPGNEQTGAAAQAMVIDIIDMYGNSQ